MTGALERCTECNPAMTSMKVYFPLKKSDNLAIMHPESSNMFHFLQLRQSLLNCNASFIFVSYYQSNFSRRDITNIMATLQDKYQYVEPVIGETKQSLVNVPN